MRLVELHDLLKRQKVHGKYTEISLQVQITLDVNRSVKMKGWFRVWLVRADDKKPEESEVEVGSASNAYLYEVQRNLRCKLLSHRWRFTFPLSCVTHVRRGKRGRWSKVVN